MNEALVLQTSLGVKAVSPVTVFAVYTANYRYNFSGASLYTLGSLIPSTLQSSASNQQTWEPQASHRKGLLPLQLFCSTLQDLESTDSPGVLHTGCPVHRSGGGGVRGSALIPVLKGFCNAALVGLATATGHLR